MSDWNEKHKGHIDKWKPSVEELLCLQMLGYTIQELYVGIETNGQFRELAQKSVCELDKAKRILDKQEKAGIVTIPYYAADYPQLLRNLVCDAPMLIHLSGNKDLIYRNDSVAVIGARAADKEGLEAAYCLSQEATQQGRAVISGLALGCDTVAHRGCLDAGGQTLAIVASGLNITHPKVNKALQDEIIAKGGAILSEYPFGVKANPTRLVARCRLQAALSRALIVAQCPVISGTMYAVRFAKEYGTAIYAVKYNSQNELNSGNKFLLDYGLAQAIEPDRK